MRMIGVGALYHTQRTDAKMLQDHATAFAPRAVVSTA
jgi:hypothetical protein